MIGKLYVIRGQDIGFTHIVIRKRTGSNRKEDTNDLKILHQPEVVLIIYSESISFRAIGTLPLIGVEDLGGCQVAFDPFLLYFSRPSFFNSVHICIRMGKHLEYSSQI